MVNVSCPAQTNGGISFVQGGETEGKPDVISCVYSAEILCGYSRTNGTLVYASQENATCPAFADSVSRLTAPLASSSSTTDTPKQSSTDSSSRQSASAAYSEPFYSMVITTCSSEAIAGGVLASILVICVLVCAGVTIFWYIRRLQRRRSSRHRESGLDLLARTISPFTLLNQANEGRSNPDTRSIDGSMHAREVLRTELQAVTEKVAELEDQETRRHSETGASHSTRQRLWRLVSARGRARSPPSDLEAQLQAAREEISILVMRMNALEASSDSPREGGRIEESPPDYATAV
ncbi:hypothetical protein R3P38DRAFT_3605917 [Favolaschia claudopus]|uniref:Uncharacterized protein n=1 Tax=Favolaschia claudopus TaxID=2862362 RepID=A0AAW0DFK3_9AGAR